MRHVIFALLVLTSFAEFALGQECDRAKLRELIGFPAVSSTYTHGGGYVDDWGDPIDYAKSIAQETARLSGGLDDVTVYRNLAFYYDQIKDTKSRDDVCDKMRLIAQPHFSTTDKTKAKSLISYCAVISYRVGFDLGEWEKLVRKALMLAPDDYEAWVSFGWLNTAKCEHAIVRDNKLPFSDWPHKSLALLSARAVSQTVADEAERHLDEARKSFDRAKQLAPTNPDCSQSRIEFLKLEYETRMGLAVTQGKQTPTGSKAPPLEIALEVRRLAGLDPNCVRRQFDAIGMILGQTGEIQLSRGVIKPKARSTVKPVFAADDEELMESCFSRIEKALAAGPTPQSPASAMVNLVLAYDLLHEFAKAEKWSRRLLEANPTNEMGWRLLELALRGAKRDREADDVARDFWKNLPSAQSAYVYARSLGFQGNGKEAENVVRAGLRIAPNDFACLIALAAITMKSRDTPESLEEASQLLNLAARSVGRDDYEFLAEYTYLRTIHTALSGFPASAGLTLLRLQSEHPDDERFTKALSAFKR